MAEYNFMESYVGPHGPHLNFLTKFTMTRKDEHRLQGRSIRGDGKNTCGVSSGRRQNRAIAALERHIERHPTDKQSGNHLDWLLSAAKRA